MQQTSTISVRVPTDLKEEFMELMEVEQKTFSKWIRCKMQEELNEKENKKKSSKIL